MCKNFLIKKLKNSTSLPPIRAIKMSMRRAKTVPPTSAMSPRTTLAAPKTMNIVTNRVNHVDTWPNKQR